MTDRKGCSFRFCCKQGKLQRQVGLKARFGSIFDYFDQAPRSSFFKSSSKITSQVYSEITSNTPPKGEEAWYHLGSRGRYLPEVVRIGTMILAVLISVAFTVLLPGPNVKAYNWFPFAAAWFVLTQIAWDLHQLRLPENVRWVSKEYYETVRIRLAYGGSVLLSISVMLSYSIVIEWVARELHHPHVKTIDGSSLTAIGTFLSFTALVALRGTNSAARSEAIFFAQCCENLDKERFAKNQTNYCVNFYDVDCPMRNGSGSQEVSPYRRPRKPRQGLLLHGGITTLFCGTVAAVDIYQACHPHQGSSGVKSQPLSLADWIFPTCVLVYSLLLAGAYIAPSRAVKFAEYLKSKLVKCWRKLKCENKYS